MLDQRHDYTPLTDLELSRENKGLVHENNINMHHL